LTNYNDFTNYYNRKFEVYEAPSLDSKYYLDRYSDVGQEWDRHSSDVGNVHWADYVRANPGLNQAWIDQRNAGTTDLARWAWGAQHYEQYGKNEPKRILPFVVGGHKGWADTDVIHYDPNNPEMSKHAFAAWHFSRKGDNEGRWASESEFYNSPGEVSKREAAKIEEERLFREKLAEEQAARDQAAAERAEAGRLAGQRGGGSQTLGTAGTATLKGKGLDSSQNKRGGGRGTTQFKRPYGTSGLSIASGTGQRNTSSSGLNI
tara:strand:+ start:158 stop:943 length:786 start_codon:yes stop_codon:yes gene_type:complete